MRKDFPGKVPRWWAVVVKVNGSVLRFLFLDII